MTSCREVGWVLRHLLQRGSAISCGYSSGFPILLICPNLGKAYPVPFVFLPGGSRWSPRASSWMDGHEQCLVRSQNPDALLTRLGQVWSIRSRGSWTVGVLLLCCKKISLRNLGSLKLGEGKPWGPHFWRTCTLQGVKSAKLLHSGLNLVILYCLHIDTYSKVIFQLGWSYWADWNVFWGSVQRSRTARCLEWTGSWLIWQLVTAWYATAHILMWSDICIVYYIYIHSWITFFPQTGAVHKRMWNDMYVYSKL